MTELLIIGSEGFIGGHLVKYFTAKGFSVNGADILSVKSSCNTYYHVDTKNSSYSFIFGSKKFNFCIFAGGNGNVALSVEKPFLDYEMNVYNVGKLLEEIRVNCPLCKFIHLSSAAVYGNPYYLPINESHPIVPVSPYGWHKYFAENLCMEYFKLHQIQSISLRIFSVYGEGLKKQIFWDAYNKYLSDNSAVTLFGDGSESSDFIYIADICKAIEVVILNADFDGGVINVANGIETTIKNALELFFSNFEHSCNLHFNNITKTGDPKNWKADITKLKLLGFIPTCSFEESIINVAKWLTTIPKKKN